MNLGFNIEKNNAFISLLKTNGIKKISTPGRRVYSKVKDLPRFYNGLGIYVLSTPSGVMSDHEARQANLGGEVLCKVF